MKKLSIKVILALAICIGIFGFSHNAYATDEQSGTETGTGHQNVQIDASDDADIEVQQIIIETASSTVGDVVLVETGTTTTTTSSSPAIETIDTTSTTVSTTIVIEVDIQQTASTSMTVDAEDVVEATGITVQSAESTTTTASTTPAQVNVRVQFETINGQLADETFTVTECPVLPGSSTTSLTAWCAVEQLATREGWAVTPSIFGDALFLSAVDTYDGADFNWWAFFHNNTFASDALNQYILQPNDHILLSYGVFPSRLAASTTSPGLGEVVTISVETFGFDSSYAASWLPATSATFTVNGIDTMTSGTLHLTASSSTPYTITATTPGSFKTDALTITPQLPQGSALVRLETVSGTLFSQTIAFSACEDGSGGQTLNAKCALDAVGTQQGWQIDYNQFGSQYFLDKVDSHATDFGQNLYWLWFHNDTFATDAVNEYIVSPNDELLFTFGVLPTRLTVSTTIPTVSTSLDIVAEQFGFDESYNPAWSPATNATFTINNLSAQQVSSGTLHLVISTTSPYSIAINKQGYTASTITLTPTTTVSSSTSTDTGESGCSSCSGGGSEQTESQPSDREQAIDDAITYLISQQQSDGGFGSLLFSDWVAMAYGTYQSSDSAFTNSRSALITYLTDSSVDSQLHIITDYERHVLGLIALNQSADRYQQSILNRFDGTQFGAPTLINDDIFAMLALDALGCCQTEMQAAADFIISKQDQQTGRISGPDLTAAAIRALRTIYSENHEAIAKAREYLKSQQESDGRIGGSIVDIDTTSWTLDALGTMGETTLGSWFTDSGETPLSHVLSKQEADGSFGMQNRVWSTAYAVLGLQHRWNPQRTVETSSSGGGASTLTTQTTSSTLDTSTSTDAGMDALQESTSSTTPLVTTTIDTATNTPQTTTQQQEAASTTPAIGGVIDDVTEEDIQETEQAQRTTPTPVTTADFEVTEEEPRITDEPSSGLQDSHAAPQTMSTGTPPLQKAARGVAGTATAMAGTLLLFLAWRFVRTLI